MGDGQTVGRINLNINKVMSDARKKGELTTTVKLYGIRRFKIKVKIAIVLIKLAGHLMGSKIVIEQNRVFY